MSMYVPKAYTRLRNVSLSAIYRAPPPAVALTRRRKISVRYLLLLQLFHSPATDDKQRMHTSEMSRGPIIAVYFTEYPIYLYYINITSVQVTIGYIVNIYFFFYVYQLFGSISSIFQLNIVCNHKIMIIFFNYKITYN